MENLLIVPRSDDEFSFLKELLDRLNIRTQVITNEEYKLLGYNAGERLYYSTFTESIVKFLKENTK